MKKKLFALCLCATLVCGIFTPVSALTAEPTTAYASTQSVLVDGYPVTFPAYALKDENGNDTNYIKLRDVADALNGSAAQFQVGWDGNVVITTQANYTANGSEMSTPFAGDRAYTPAVGSTEVDGTNLGLDAIVLKDDSGNGYTYYKLRDLAAALGFQVDWTPEVGIAIDTARADNIFYNADNAVVEQDKVSVRPRYVYWKNGELVADCFVLNGYDHEVKDIHVERLAFASADGSAIADGTFGVLDGVSLKAGEVIVWTFRFRADAVQQPGADLATLNTTYSTGYAEVKSTENVFFKDNNNIWEQGKVSIRPRQVHWEDGVLVAQCYVINGTDTAVSNIDVTALAFADGRNIIIADSSFGVLDGQKLDSHKHLLWTLRFLPNSTITPNADLSTLRCTYNVNFQY